MLYFLGGFAILCGLLLLGWVFVNTSPARLARVLKWTDSLAQLGFKPGYRLDRLSGRYVSLEDEQNRPRSVVALRTDKPILDVWFWLHNVNRYFSLIDATYGSATYLPMSDGALFSVSVGASGLVARPLNDRAKLAVERWN